LDSGGHSGFSEGGDGERLPVGMFDHAERPNVATAAAAIWP
jgi:hypothetical protein